MFKFYHKYIVPRLINKSMSSAEFNTTREGVVAPARGVVLEIGFGSGYNLPFYKGVEGLYALDPSQELYDYASERIKSVSFPVTYLKASAEHIPLAENSVDTVVSTWSLCSVDDVPKVLQEIRRVLKPQGKFIFVEHGQSPEKIKAWTQRLVTPLMKNFTGNCHLDRKVDDLIRESGLLIESIQMFPEEGRPLMFSYRGIATLPF